MISYYGYTLSPNQLETGEGFLICRNVPIARIGTQQYIGSEIGLNSNDIIDVDRPESEVFSPAAVASFEGKPVTNDHPTELVTPDNVSRYEMGHAQNVRRGTGKFSDFLIADLHIHDATLIEAVKNGKRQISCGYECEYVEDESGIHQTNIRGNHIAVVDEGRAGAKAAIMDSNTPINAENAEREKKMGKKSTLLKLFGIAANGKTDEELTKLALDTADALEGEETPEVAEEVAEEVEEAAQASTTDELTGFDALNAKMDKLIELLTPAEPKVEVETKEDIDAAIEELTAKEEATDLTGEEAAVVPAEEMDANDADDACKDAEDACKDAAMDESLRLHILKSVRESVCGITDEAQRKAVTDAILGAVNSKKDDVQAIVNASASFVQTKVADIDTVQNAYRQMNPHTRKEV